MNLSTFHMEDPGKFDQDPNDNIKKNRSDENVFMVGLQKILNSTVGQIGFIDKNQNDIIEKKHDQNPKKTRILSF